MTWMEKFEEQLKTPAIGTPEWFRCIPTLEIETAKSLVAHQTPVVVQRGSGSDTAAFLILFDGTEFVAGGFDDETAAERFAAHWNRLRA